jgi:betaine-aldehyde dehydrogenase
VAGRAAGSLRRSGCGHGLDADSPLIQKDLFGPLLSIEAFGGEDDAVPLANATPYGLAASV